VVVVPPPGLPAGAVLAVARHIIQFNFIKYVRWVLVDGLDGEDLEYPYLHFESNFDGPWSTTSRVRLRDRERHPAHVGSRPRLPAPTAAEP
jgi:hypothetical protein